MKGITIKFNNIPNDDGTVSSHSMDDCLIAQNGSPSAERPQVRIHLPKTDITSVDGGWFEYDSWNYHITGQSVPNIAENTPTRWNRYVVAERMY